MRTKRVIRLVFPTLCSPRKTSLNFFRGLLLEVNSPAGEGVDGPDMTEETVESLALGAAQCR